MAMKNKPGSCCCCPECLLLELKDRPPFLYSDFATEDGNWTEDSGTWTYTNDGMGTSSNNARTLHSSPVTSSSSYRIEMLIEIDRSADAVCYSYAFWEDSSNHLYVKWSVDSYGGGAQFPLNWEVVAMISGTPTTLLTGTTTFYANPLGSGPQFGRVVLCHDSGDLSVQIDGGVSYSWSEATITGWASLGVNYGFGSGDLDGTTMQATMCIVRNGHSDCSCRCIGVKRGTFPTNIQLVITGALDTGCATCDEEMNGTYLLDPMTVGSEQPAPTSTASGAILTYDDYCHWLFRLDDTCHPKTTSDLWWLWLEFSVDESTGKIGNLYYARGRFWDSGIAYAWWEVFGSVTCGTVNATDVWGTGITVGPDDLSPFTSGIGICDMRSASITITAVA